MTITTFNKLYQCYKDDFDLELTLKLSRTTYKQAYYNSMKDEEWF